MRWDLDALKLLSRNETVPGVALRDAIAVPVAEWIGQRIMEVENER